MNIIKLEDVTVLYQDTPALTGISLEVEDGEFLGIIGPNGGGKTTLIKVILGLIKPSKGKVEVFGRPPGQLGKDRHLIGYIPQRNLVDWDFPVSVFDLVMMGRYGRLGLFKRPSRQDREIVLGLLEAVQMQDFVERQFGQLSGGQQQRVFIARALATEPKLLVLDEPLGGVDVRAQEEFYQLLHRQKQERGLTVIVVTHDIAVVSTHVEKVACLNQILFVHGPPAEVFRTDTLQKVYGCEIELLAHGAVPHRVLEEHK